MENGDESSLPNVFFPEWTICHCSIMLFGQADGVLSAIEGLAKLRGFSTGNYIVSEDSPIGYRMFIF